MRTPPHLGGHANRTHIDEGVLNYLIETEGPFSNFVDVGCGPGGMLTLAEKQGIEAYGYDGDFNLSHHSMILHDFTTGPPPIPTSLQGGKGLTLGWSVEFLEHLEEKYLDNVFPLFGECDLIVVTAAPPGKSGHHHVNCRDHQYWMAEFGKRGFSYETALTGKVREVSTMKRNFMRENGLVFWRTSLCTSG